MPYALIENGVVTNLYLPEDPPDGYIAVPDHVQPGYLFTAGEFVSPPEPETGLPNLTARQLRLGLVLNGLSPAAVEASLDAIEDQQQRELAKIEWEYATQFERSHPLIAQVAAGFGLTTAQVDAMWEAATGL